jgi:hypothetical protein
LIHETYRDAIVVHPEADTHRLDVALIGLGLARDLVLPEVDAVGDVGEAVRGSVVQRAGLPLARRSDDQLARLGVVLQKPRERLDDGDPDRAVVLHVLGSDGARLSQVADARLEHGQLLHVDRVGVLLLLCAEAVDGILYAAEDGVQLLLCAGLYKRQQLLPQRFNFEPPRPPQLRLQLVDDVGSHELVVPQVLQQLRRARPQQPLLVLRQL